MSDLAGWTARPYPPPTEMVGRTVRLAPFDAETHGDALFAAVGGDANAHLWRFTPSGPYPSATGFLGDINRQRAENGWRTFVVIPNGDAPAGMASYMRVRPEAGSLELGAVVFHPRLQRTTAATEAVYLTLVRAFDALGYRRFEWKCHAGNAPSLRAALRFGFTFEGVFRQDMVQKGANRDTAWLSIVDSEWPRLRAGFDAWLAPSNFDADGRALMSLEEARAQASAPHTDA